MNRFMHRLLEVKIEPLLHMKCTVIINHLEQKAHYSDLPIHSNENFVKNMYKQYKDNKTIIKWEE